jgi:hypothetical protein
MAVVLMNADRVIYGRYCSKPAKGRRAGQHGRAPQGSRGRPEFTRLSGQQAEFAGKIKRRRSASPEAIPT